MKFKVGIDLSTTNTGIVVLKDDNSFVCKEDLNLLPFNDGNWEANANRIISVVTRLWFFCFFTHGIKELEIGIELANFRNPKLTQRFSLYCGVFLGKLYELYRQYKNEVNNDVKMRIITFNSNTWQSYLGLKPQDTREIRKQRAREFTSSNCSFYKDYWTEDVCDAYCIAYYLTLLKSTEEIRDSVKLKKTKIISTEKKLWAIEKKINTQLQLLVVLDKERNKKKIENINKKIKELREEKERICQEKHNI